MLRNIFLRKTGTGHTLSKESGKLKGKKENKRQQKDLDWNIKGKRKATGLGGAKRHLRNHLQGVAEPLGGLEVPNGTFETLEKNCGGVLGG